MPSVPGGARIPALRSLIALLALAGLLAALPAGASAAESGGFSTRSGYEAELPGTGITGEAEAPATGEAPAPAPTGATATLVNGRAIAPAGAPPAVRKVIAAANKIRTRPYIWGGGHGQWWDRGYDCSGAVSFALHGARLMGSPLTSGSMETFGSPGPGRWITIYANASHAYAVIAGLRWDTAGDESGTGPRWHEGTAAAAGGTFVARHPSGY
jgi:hypothetical protein